MDGIVRWNAFRALVGASSRMAGQGCGRAAVSRNLLGRRAWHVHPDGGGVRPQQACGCDAVELARRRSSTGPYVAADVCGVDFDRCRAAQSQSWCDRSTLKESSYRYSQSDPASKFCRLRALRRGTPPDEWVDGRRDLLWWLCGVGSPRRDPSGPPQVAAAWGALSRISG